MLDTNTREVISAAAVSIIMRFLGSGLTFLLSILVARQLGVAGAGVYFLAWTIVLFLSIVARMGLDNSFLRFSAIYFSRGEWGELHGIFRLVMLSATICSAFLTIVVFVFSEQISVFIFKRPELAMPLRLMCGAIISFGLMSLLSEGLKGVKRVRDAMLVSSVFYPLFGVTIIVPLTNAYGTAGASLTYFMATGMSVVLGLFLWRRAVRAMPARVIPFDKIELVKISLPLFVMSIVNRGVVPWAPLLILGLFASNEDVGRYGAANRVAMLGSLVVVAANVGASAKFAALYAEGNLRDLARLVRHVTVIGIVLTVPIMIFVFFYNREILGLFGDDFKSAGTLLIVLASGHAVTALVGPMGPLLLMTGHQSEANICVLISGGIVVGLSIILIPIYGVLGAAFAGLSAMCAFNVTSRLYVTYKLGISYFPSTIFKNVHAE